MSRECDSLESADSSLERLEVSTLPVVERMYCSTVATPDVRPPRRTSLQFTIDSRASAGCFGVVGISGQNPHIQPAAEGPMIHDVCTPVQCRLLSIQILTLIINTTPTFWLFIESYYYMDHDQIHAQ